jgi:chromosomal replication initiation ATPase DnaA
VARGAEDFLVAPCNQVAADWIGRWPDWPSPAVVLVGPAGSGKTHLGQLWSARSGAEPVDPTRFDLEQAAGLIARTGAAWVDEADRFVADSGAEAVLLHLYNLLKAAGGSLLLTARTAPAAWPLGLPDLASRLKAAMVATIDAPDDTLLASVALKLFADRQLAVGEEVIAYLLTRGERSFAWIARMVDAIDRAALAAKRPVTTALVREILTSSPRDQPGSRNI